MKNNTLFNTSSIVMLGLVVGILLAGCDSSDSTIVPGINDDQSIRDEPVVNVLPVLAGATGVQSFELLEDGVLRARFYTSEPVPARPVTILSLPDHGLLTMQAEGRVLVYQPDRDFWGSYTFSYQNFDGVKVTVSLTVKSVNDPPVLSADIPTAAAQGRLFVHQLSATDADGDKLRYVATGLPGWLSLDSQTGLLGGRPTQNDIGVSAGVSLKVIDEAGLSDEVSGIRFEVIDVNDVPTLNLSQVPARLLGRGEVQVQVFPDDSDGDPVSIEVEDNRFIRSEIDHGWLTLTVSDVNEVTDVNLVLKAFDPRGGVTREILPIRVYPVTASGRGVTLAGIRQGRAVHVVVLGDGYAADQQALFREHVERTMVSLQSDPGIAGHMDALSIHMVGTVSKDSGADDTDQVDARDTYYDSTYNCGSIQRLICANTLTLLETALDEYPDFDQVILLVNDRRYGGSGNSGGSTAITSAYAPEIALHEMGHSLANLADEYVDNLIVETAGFPPFREGRYANVTALTSPAEVPWAHWIDSSQPLPQFDGEIGVGLFEGGLYRSEGVFRPTFDSRMRSFDAAFGPVNSERWILRLYEETNGGIRGL